MNLFKKLFHKSGPVIVTKETPYPDRGIYNAEIGGRVYTANLYPDLIQRLKEKHYEVIPMDVWTAYIYKDVTDKYIIDCVISSAYTPFWFYLCSDKYTGKLVLFMKGTFPAYDSENGWFKLNPYYYHRIGSVGVI